METNEKIRGRLRYLVSRDGLNPHSFAKNAGIDPSSFHRVLHGELGISDLMLKKIADYSGIEPSWIIFGLQDVKGTQRLNDNEVRYVAEMQHKITVYENALVIMAGMIQHKTVVPLLIQDTDCDPWIEVIWGYLRDKINDGVVAESDTGRR